MRWRWLLWDFVHPDLDLPSGVRSQIWARTIVKAEERGEVVLHRFFGLIAFGITFAVLFVIIGNLGILRGMVRLLAAFVFAVATGWSVSAFHARSTIGPLVFESLREFGYDVCPECGYWLRGLHETIERCPECGAVREPPGNLVRKDT